MKIGAKKLKLNNWQFRLILEKCPPYIFGGFVPHILVQLTKFHQKPPMGDKPKKGLHYQGFTWEYTLPTYKWIIEVRRIKIGKVLFPYSVKINEDQWYY